MSEITNILESVVAERQAWTSDPVQNLRTGAWFTAELEMVDPLIVQAELGEDAREVVCLHVYDDQQAAGIQSQDKVKFRLFGQSVTYRVVKRRDNAASVQTDFWAMQIVSGKDT
jgi:hypothetical protein